MQLILKFGAIEILIKTDFRELRIRYQNFDKSLAISVCKVAIIILIRVKRGTKRKEKLSFQFQLPNFLSFYKLSRVMRKQMVCICENRDAEPQS